MKKQEARLALLLAAKKSYPTARHSRAVLFLLGNVP